MVVEPGVVPARLGMAEEPEPLHQPRRQPRTSATWAGVSGEGRAPAIEARNSAILAIGSPWSSPWRTEPAADHRPRPADAAPAMHVRRTALRAGEVDVVEDPHHVAGRRGAHVGNGVRASSRALQQVPVAVERIGWMRQVDEQPDTVALECGHGLRRTGIGARDQTFGDGIARGDRHHRGTYRSSPLRFVPPSTRPLGEKPRRARNATARRRSASSATLRRPSASRASSVSSRPPYASSSAALGEEPLQPAGTQLLLRPPPPVAARLHPARELRGEGGIVEVAVLGRSLDRLPRDTRRNLARRELLLDLCDRLHPGRERPHDEAPGPSPGEHLLDRSTAGIVDLVSRGDSELCERFGLHSQPCLAVEPERDRSVAHVRAPASSAVIALDRETGHGSRLLFAAMIVRALPVLAAALLLGGCGGQDDDVPPSTTSTTPTPALEGASTAPSVWQGGSTTTKLLTDVRAASHARV